MKFLCKVENYNSQRAAQGVFKNPFVKSTITTIDTQNKILKVSFALQYEQNDVTRTLESNTLTFSEAHAPTTIEDGNGNVVEIIEYLTGGGQYDAEKVNSWGQPSFDKVQQYFDLDSVWNDLQFKDTPFKQLAIDYVLNTVKIEGLLLKEYFSTLEAA